MSSPFFEDEEVPSITISDPVKQTTIRGGDIKTDSQIFKYVMVVVLVIAVLWLLSVIFKQIRIAGEDYNQRTAHNYFNNIRGEDFDAEAKNAIAYGEAIENPRAIDHYRVGAVYLLNARDRQAAHRHFNNALRQIIEGEVDVREAPFILDRIDDFKDHFIDLTDVDDLPLQEAMLAHFNIQHELNNQVATKKVLDIAKDDPEFKQKTILARQNWQSDSQNVHDSAIYEEMKEQLLKVMDENKKIKNIQLHGYEEAVNWLRVRYKNSAKKNDLEKALSMIGNNYEITGIPGVHEKDILTAVWQRTYDERNKDRAGEIKEAMGAAVLDCVERGSVVCMSGRTSKVWQALARLDCSDDTGVLKSKQAIRNEIYQKAAKVVDDYVGINGSASQALKTSYNNNENSEQVKELIECIKNQIDHIRFEYENLLPKDQIDLIIEECKSVV